MDIYTAKNAVDRLHAYVQDIATEKPRMYRSSKVRLIDIANTCQQVLELLSDILQDELINESDPAELNTEESALLTNIKSNLEQIGEFLDTNTEQTNKHEKVASSTNELTKSQKKYILSNYLSVFSDVVENSTAYPEAHECAELIYNWLVTRFQTSFSACPQFRYNITKFPSWIIDIIIGYAKNHGLGITSMFVSEIDRWLNSIQNPDTTNIYALPYEIFQIEVDETKSCLSLEAIVLWDILWSCGLNKLSENTVLPMEESTMYDLAARLQPDVLDDYVDFTYNREILAKCKFTKLYD